MNKPLLQSSSTTSASSLSTDFASSIEIRRYRPSDFDGVHACFLRSFSSNYKDAFPVVLKSRYVAVPYLSSFSLVLVGSLKLRVLRRSSSLMTAAVASTVGALVVLPLVYLHNKVKYALYNYSKLTLKQDDLNGIETVYGGKGCFLVAVQNDKVVGTIACQDKGDGVFEIRRVTVDPALHKRGIGKRLLNAVEQELGKPQRLFLICSSVQFAAHALYEKGGYRQTKEFSMPELPYLFRGITTRQYEKSFAK